MKKIFYFFSTFFLFSCSDSDVKKNQIFLSCEQSTALGIEKLFLEISTQDVVMTKVPSEEMKDLANKAKMMNPDIHDIGKDQKFFLKVKEHNPIFIEFGPTHTTESGSTLYRLDRANLSLSVEMRLSTEAAETLEKNGWNIPSASIYECSKASI
tara:strand:- start:493 stop:954 length:462 start_codon:yes stop_codon:yes gene_type:complete